MEPEIQILPIHTGTDGDGRKWPKHHYERNDEYFKERIATDKWIHDLPGGPQPGVIYRLDKMPGGYAGFQRTRPDSKHVDRYIYGHPNGQFRSLNEFYPHFKHLMEFGGPVSCTCKLCVNGVSRAKPAAAKASGNGRVGNGRAAGSGRASESSRDGEPQVEPTNLISPFKPGTHDAEQRLPQKRKLVDIEGVPDIYETLIEQLKDTAPDHVDEPITERMSPDWRVGNIRSKEQVEELLRLPRYVPRPGELVLFADLSQSETIAWDEKAQTFKCCYASSGTMLTQPKWKAGVIIQTPKEQLLDNDLVSDEHKQRAVNESGFRIQPLSKLCDDRKAFSKQQKYVPLHAIRPFYLWQECLKGVKAEDSHPTVAHAVTVASSFCVIGRFRFRGVWPNATVFARGVYLGPELILLGDTVRLTPRTTNNEQPPDKVTDVMVVTAIRLRFVNLNMEDDDMAPKLPGLPYQTCLHFSGRVFTLDPHRSFDGVGKVPIDPQSNALPPGLAAYGQWYHYSDPEQTSARTELPYTRILGRCVEYAATLLWFNSSTKPLSTFQAVNAKAPIKPAEINRGLRGILDARIYSQKNDKRIKSQEGKSWFWADTRVEQLDLHEVNQRDVGTKNKERTKGHMAKWKTSLKAIDGKKGALEEYQAVKSKLKEQAKLTSSYGMMRAPASSTEPEQAVSGSASGSSRGSGLDEEVHDEGDGDAMDIDDAEPFNQTEQRRPLPASRERSSGSGSRSASGDYGTPPTAPAQRVEAITLSESEDEDHLAANQLVGELSKNMRRNDASAKSGGSSSQAIQLD